MFRGWPRICFFLATHSHLLSFQYSDRVLSTFDEISGALCLAGTSFATLQQPPGGKHAAFAFQVGVSVFLQLDDQARILELGRFEFQSSRDSILCATRHRCACTVHHSMFCEIFCPWSCLRLSGFGCRVQFSHHRRMSSCNPSVVCCGFQTCVQIIGGSQDCITLFTCTRPTPRPIQPSLPHFRLPICYPLISKAFPLSALFWASGPLRSFVPPRMWTFQTGCFKTLERRSASDVVSIFATGWMIHNAPCPPALVSVE